jgi:hypothetical protein
MADGSRSVVLEAEAAEAARETKAEVLEVQSAPAPARKARRLGRKAGWAEFIVDVWITNLHSVKFGFYKHSRNQAKSRQFTSDMDIFAEVIEHGERTGLLGYREDLWRKNAGMDRRLVLKLFNETINWRASMDLMIGRSLQLTLGARGLPVTAFSINAGEHDDVVYLERSANKWPLAPEHFSFFLLDDGQVFSLGGKWRGRVHPDHVNPRLLAVLKLFCGMLIFNGNCRRQVRRLAHDVRAGRYEPKIEKQEADLYMNPRRVR